jgi:DNA-directed RNA polymerase subunit RPC12/RpoP
VAPRYRCDACGNLTRFDVTTTRTTKAFHHYSVGGELTLEEEQVLAQSTDEVVCRWCGHGRGVVDITQDEQDPQSAVS